jgi:hypothetical protein
MVERKPKAVIRTIFSLVHNRYAAVSRFMLKVRGPGESRFHVAATQSPTVNSRISCSSQPRLEAEIELWHFPCCGSGGSLDRHAPVVYLQGINVDPLLTTGKPCDALDGARIKGNG